MGQAIIYLIAFFITFPFLATWIVFFISKKIYNHQWRAIHLSVNLTTFLYICSTFVMIKLMFNQYFLGVFLIISISILALIIIIQWKTKTEVLFVRAVKQLWRVCFLMFSILYSILVITGIIIKII